MSNLQVPLELLELDLSKPIELSFLSSLCQACQQWGFFYVTNHGVPKSLFTEILSLSRRIFSLPSDSKLKLGPLSYLKTYTPPFIASPFFESLRVSGPDFFASAKSSADELVAEQSLRFSEILHEYGSKMMALSRTIMEVLLISMGDGFDKKFYESEFSDSHGYLRIVNYSPPETMDDQQVEGLGKHTDMSCITIVYQDEVGGLQLRSKEGNWIDIPWCENALVVNIGDMMQAWSNDKFRSSEHRVVLTKPVNRLSLAFFFCFEDQKVVLAPDDVVGEGKLRLYKSFACLDYLKFRESNEVGKFDKIGKTVKDFAGLIH